jgi:ribonuclease BN (tRNA processing enzyme)
MSKEPPEVEIAFLGTGNAFAAEGRAFSSVLLDGRFLFDCGPTVLQQLRKLDIASDAIEVVMISHFHADHYFGLPFLLLDGWHSQRTKDLFIAGPPGIEERTERVMDIAYPGLPGEMPFRRHYLEVNDGLEAEVAGMAFLAVAVEHVPSLECFAFRAQVSGRSLVYSGDTRLCDGLLRLVAGADAVIVECSCAGESVHLSPAGVAEVQRHVSPGSRVFVTHLDGARHPDGFAGLTVAADLARYHF